MGMVSLRHIVRCAFAYKIQHSTSIHSASLVHGFLCVVFDLPSLLPASICFYWKQITRPFMETRTLLGVGGVGGRCSLFKVCCCPCSIFHEIKTTRPLSRFHLQYHTPRQILWGLLIGIALGISLYVVTELAPSRRPNSVYARTRIFLVENKVSTWLQIRDGWAIWADGGREDEWIRWRAEWDKRRIRAMVQARKSQ